MQCINTLDMDSKCRLVIPFDKNGTRIIEQQAMREHATCVFFGEEGQQQAMGERENIHRLRCDKERNIPLVKRQAVFRSCEFVP